jgi:hypothetical protein
MGFEGIDPNEVGTFLNYATTIVNSTDAKLSLRYGGIIVDGHAASPLKLVPAGKRLKKRKGGQSKQDMAELWRMHCVTSGFLPSDNFFSADTSSRVLTVAPSTSLTVSFVIRDPRNSHAILCSAAGCYPTGTMRYYVRVDTQDYIFVWPGRSAVYCGK